MNPQFVLDLFQSRSLLDELQAAELLEEVKSSGKDIKRLLTDYGYVQSEADVYRIVADELGAEYVDLRRFEPPRALLDLVPAAVARMHGAIPVNLDEQGLYVAMLDPLNPQNAEDLRFALGKNIVVVVADSDRVEELINTSYAAEAEGMEDILAGINIDAKEGAVVESEVNAAPIVRYVDLVL